MRTVIKLVVTFVFCLSFIGSNLAQTEEMSEGKNFEFGLEIQAYPTGIIPGLRIEKFLNANTSINLRLGYQIINHRDLGVQENEEGYGYGASFAYRRFFKPDHKGLSLAFRTDLWFNKMDWQDLGVEGTTNIVVVQPTLMGEYTFRPNSNFSITPSLSFGWEWNVSTDGEPTGEGAIILIGCTTAWKF